MKTTTTEEITMTTTTVEVVGPNLAGPDQRRGEFHVHAAGCQDIARLVKRAGGRVDPTFGFEATSRVDVVLGIYDFIDEDEVEEYLSEVHFAPCVGHLPIEADGDQAGGPR